MTRSDERLVHIIDDHRVHTTFCRGGRVGNVIGLERRGYVFGVRLVTLLVDEETHGGYRIHFVANSGTKVVTRSDEGHVHRNDHGVHTTIRRCGRVGNVAGLERHGYVFCVRLVTLLVDKETYGGYSIHFVGDSDTEEKVEKLHNCPVSSLSVNRVKILSKNKIKIKISIFYSLIIIQKYLIFLNWLISTNNLQY